MPVQAADTADLAAARRMYEEGVLPSGGPLVGRRPDGTVATGQAAACVNCHRSSGMGSVEGDIQVTPITGRFLFPQVGEKPLATMDPRVGKRMNLRREPHTDSSFAAALREGRGSDGQILGPLMPRYALGDTEMAALTQYVRQLSVEPSPGVEGRTLRFATVITPGVEPMRRQVLLDMLRTAFSQKNGSTVTGNSSRRHMVTAAELVLGTENKWTLDVWELTGSPDTWADQLNNYYKLAPPFALLSGLTNSTWEPMEKFCETRQVPCWFPSVPVAPSGAGNPAPRKYSFYFSRGVGLEADVLASHLGSQPLAGKRSARVVQLYRAGDAGATAAEAFATKFKPQSKSTAVDAVDVSQWPADVASSKLQLALSKLKAEDSLVLWLRPSDLKAFEAVLAGTPARKFLSGSLISATSAFVPERLRSEVQLVYPYELPQVRAGNVAYMHIWLKLRRIPLIDEAMQSEVYFALNLLTDTLAEMLDNLYRDYMVERAESMIGQRETRKAEDEVRDQRLLRPRVKRTPMDAGLTVPPINGTGYAEHVNGLREGTTIYPRLTLGPGQRFASKGAYIAHFDPQDLATGRLIADTAWITP